MNRSIITDEAIVRFLLEKGVEVRPPRKSNRLLDAAVAGLASSEGITGQATAHTAQQLSKNAKQDEWRSWKQWALSHPDWSEWYNAYQLEQQKIQEAEEKERLEKLSAEAADAGFSDIDEYRLFQKRQIEIREKQEVEIEHRQKLFSFMALCGAVGVVSIALSAVFFFQSKTPDKPNQEQSQVTPATPLPESVLACLKAVETNNYGSYDSFVRS